MGKWGGGVAGSGRKSEMTHPEASLFSGGSKEGLRGWVQRRVGQSWSTLFPLISGDQSGSNPVLGKQGTS